MVDWLAIWGITKATGWVFNTMFEDLAKDLANDAAKSYVGKSFKGVYTVIHKDPLARATGLALKELVGLFENELLREHEPQELPEWIYDIQRFIKRPEVQQTIASLYLDPDYTLDPAIFATAWSKLRGAHDLPDGFNWSFIAKRFAAKVATIRNSSSELRETFESLAKAQDSAALQALAGIPPDFNLDTYREALVERYGNLDFASLDTTGPSYNNVRLWSVFVPQSVRECHEYDPQLLEIPKEHLQRLADAGELDPEQLAESEKFHEERRRAYVSQPLRPVLAMADDSTIQRLVIIGDPGSGKSSLLRYLALRWARIDDATLRYTQPLPLLIELRAYSRWSCPSGKGFLKYLHEAPTWHRLNQQTLKHLLDQPDRVFLLLDGLDEVFDPAERELVVNDIHRFSNDHPRVRLLVTSRVVGYKPKRLRDADFRHVMLQDLDDEQITDFLHRWHDITFNTSATDAQYKRDRLANAIHDSRSIAQLAGNPLLLTMMAILNRHQELPRDRVDLYQQCARLLLHQWDVERTLDKFPGLSAEIGLREKTDILRRIAYAMQTQAIDQSRANYIDATALQSIIEDYLRAELHFTQARAAARSLVQQLRTRNFILCDLGADSYAFVHRTFLEYFCATEIVHQFNVTKTLSENDLVALFDTHCRDDAWREVLRLTCGQIDELVVGRIIERLASQIDIAAWDGESPLPELLLAIGCLSEVRNVARLEVAGKILIDTLLEIYIPSMGDIGFHEELLSAVTEVGTRWPGSASLPAVVMGLENQVDEDTWAADYLARTLAVVHPIHSTIQLLANCKNYGFRTGALQALAERWPDENTRELLQARAIRDHSPYPRRTALEALANKWPDERTRELLEQRAILDYDFTVRSAALEALANEWPDERTRTLLERRIIEDRSHGPRSAALQALADKWPNEQIRKLLEQCAIKDSSYKNRCTALQNLADKWPDKQTRKLLEQRIIGDTGKDVRSAGLRAMADKWPDEQTRKLLATRAVQDRHGATRGAACSALSRLHSELGCILPTKDLDGRDPYLDPLKPIPRDHIERAANKLGIPSEEVDALVASLSEFLGWDVTLGARPGNRDRE